MIVLKKQRKAFSMITAIFVIVIMSAISVIVFNLSGKMVKDTTFQFRKEQAVLLARSYTELAIMSATANDSSVTNCTDEIVGRVGGDANDVASGGGYNINVKIAYVGNGLACGDVQNTTNIGMDDNVYIVVDTVVQYRDAEVVSATSNLATAPWVSYRRRTTQKL